MQSLDLFGLQRDRRIAPTEADIRMMAFGFREFTNLLNKGKRLAEIAKPEAPLDAVSFVRQLPVWGLCVKELSLLAREWRYSPATGSTGFASKSFGHVACPSCQPSPALRLANYESDVAISANQEDQGTVITAAAAPGWISWGRSRVRHPYGADAVRLNHPRRDLVRSIGVCRASPPTPSSRAGAFF